MIRVGILTVSDRRAGGERADASGPALARQYRDGLPAATLVETGLVADEAGQVSAQLIHWADDLHLDLILTTGGTGFAPRDVTPEATLAVIEREAPGLAEAMRAASLRVTLTPCSAGPWPVSAAAV